MTIFVDDTDYRKFVYVLGDVMEEFSVKCWNFCLMSNHYHATLQPSRPNLSQVIRQLNSVYAQWWNRRHSRVGHAFQGRFKDQIVQLDDGYLLALTRYVAMNPVRARLVERPEDWRWSSYSAIAGLTSCPAFLDVSATLRLFGDDDVRIQRARFAEFVTGDPDDTIVDRIRSNERILGNRLFKTSSADARSEFEIRTNVPVDSPLSEVI